MSTPQFETILLEIRDGIAVITLNRPERLNAWTPRMMLDLIRALDVTDADDDVRAVIMTGSGRGFCAGADLAAGGATFGAGTKEAERAALGDNEDPTRDGGGRFTLRILESLKPIIAAVNGPAVGVGATMQLAMDIRIASTSAKFGFVFARRGLTPEACSSWFLPRIVGVSTALEWCYSGRVFAAEEALQRGLVRSIHGPDELMPAALSIAREIADNAAPVSVATTRQLIWRGLMFDHPMLSHRADSRSLRMRGASADAREGISAFLEKRAPDYPDRVSADMPAIWPDWVPPSWK